MLARELLPQNSPHPTGSNLQRVQEWSSSLRQLILGDTLIHPRQQICLNKGRNRTTLCFCHDEEPSPNKQRSNILPIQGDYTLQRRRHIRSISLRKALSTSSNSPRLLRLPDSLHADRLAFSSAFGSKFNPRNWEVLSKSCYLESKYLQSSPDFANIVQK